MKKLIALFIFSAFAAIFPLAALAHENCGKECERKHATVSDYRTGKVAKDPVCNMDVKTSGTKNVYEYKGKKYYFCNADNMEKFKKEPEKYISANTRETCGKHDAKIRGTAYRTGKVVKDPVCGMDVNTETAKYTYEYKGKKYYFCQEADMAKFKANPAKYLDK